MVRAYLPQVGPRNIDANTINPPQGFILEGGVIPTGFIKMLFEDGNTMIYEDGNIMIYEGPNDVPADWFDPLFRSRIALTIQSSQVIGGAESNFQMLVDSTFPDIVDRVQLTGADIRFAGTDKVQLPYQIEKFDPLTGELTAWTKKPTVDTGEITYLYFNNPDATDAQAPNDVWNVNNVLVQHFNETDIVTAPTGVVKDSTVNANNFTPVNMDNSNIVAGQIDGGLEFNAGATSNEELLGPTPVADVLDEVVKDFTVMAWVKLDSSPTATRAIMGRESQWNWGVSATNMMYILFPGLGFEAESIANINLTNQVHLAITVENIGPNLVMRYFADKVDEGTQTINGATEAMPGQNRWVIGMQQQAGGGDWEGNISENRVYDSVLSFNKIQTIYNNEKTPGEPGTPGFYAISPVKDLDPIPADWFDPTFKKRTLVTIQASQITGTHTDYPFLLNQIFTPLINNMQSAGQDIRFTSVDGQTVFPVEVQEANNTTGLLIAWTKLPTIDGTTTFYMYFDNPTVSAFPTPEDVWLNAPAETQTYVYHMTTVNPFLLDSTTNSEMVNGTQPTVIAGKIGGAATYDGTFETLTPSSGPAQANATAFGWMSMWVNPTDVASAHYIMNFDNNWAALVGFQANNFNFFTYPTGVAAPSQFPATAGVFTKLDFVVTPGSPNQVAIYKNGVETAASPFDDVASRGLSNNLVFGSFGNLPARYIGILDEFRFIQNTPSPSTISDRISTTFNNEDSPTTFYSLGPVRSIC